jgi:translocation and assembly module TamB
MLAGDRLRLDRVGASWDLAQAAGAWTVRRLEVDSALGSLASSGTLPVPAGTPARIEGRLDLAALARQLPHALRLPEAPTLLRGAAGVRIDLRDEGGRVAWDVAARVSDLLWDRDTIDLLRAPLDLSAQLVPGAEGLRIGGRLELHDPAPSDGPDGHPDRSAVLTAAALYRADSDRVELSELSLAGAFGTLRASGQCDEPGGRRRIDLRGTLDPDWAALNEILADRVEPGAHVEGEPLSFRVQGPLASASPAVLWKGLETEWAVNLREATVSGIRVGPATIAVRGAAGRLAVEPIVATINGGRLRLEPEFVLDGEGGPVLRLGPGTSIEDAEVNEELTRRVLAYVAPVLEQAARPRGRVSVAIARAEIP